MQRAVLHRLCLSPKNMWRKNAFQCAEHYGETMNLKAVKATGASRTLLRAGLVATRLQWQPSMTASFRSLLQVGFLFLGAVASGGPTLEVLLRHFAERRVSQRLGLSALCLAPYVREAQQEPQPAVTLERVSIKAGAGDTSLQRQQAHFKQAGDSVV